MECVTQKGLHHGLFYKSSLDYDYVHIQNHILFSLKADSLMKILFFIYSHFPYLFTHHKVSPYKYRTVFSFHGKYSNFAQTCWMIDFI